MAFAGWVTTSFAFSAAFPLCLGEIPTPLLNCRDGFFPSWHGSLRAGPAQPGEALQHRGEPRWGFLVGTGDSAAGREGPARVSDGHVCARPSFPPATARTPSSIPLLKVGRCYMCGAEMLPRGKRCGPYETAEKPSSPGSGSQTARGFSFRRVLLLPV